ncbi:MAG: hypothetical protein V4637_07615 [Pseudomonadota bacterium]
MTIYMVQHVFSRPRWELDWNAWYADNLKILLSVPGFRTGQRFKALTGTPPRYMAIYTVDSPAVFKSKRYADAGGGGSNSAQFRPAYQVWIRNLFEGMERAAEVGDDQYLLSIDSADKSETVAEVTLTWLEATGFHKSTLYRGIGVIESDQLEAVRSHASDALYQPITAQQGQRY